MGPNDAERRSRRGPVPGRRALSKSVPGLTFAFLIAAGHPLAVQAQEHDASLEEARGESSPGGSEESASESSDASTEALEGESEESEAAEALEAPREDSAQQVRVAVLVLAVGNVDHLTADALTEVAIAAVARRGGVSIVGKEEFQALLNQGEARSIECVSSTACLGRIGVELGVDELVAGTVGRRGASWVFNLNRIDIRSGQVAARSFREVEGDVGALADAIQSAVPELYARAQQPATLLIVSNIDGAEVLIDGTLVGVYRGEPVQLREISPGRREVVVSAAGYYDWNRTVTVAAGTTLQVEAILEAPQAPEGGSLSSLVYVGAVAAGIGLAAGIGFGVASQKDPDPELTRDQAIGHVDARRREAIAANVGFSLAVAGGIALGLGLLLSDWGPGETDVAVSASPDGAVMSYRRAF
ncbi:MAG: PEGA domain-containing protein [Myxococcota bacterium]